MGVPVIQLLPDRPQWVPGEWVTGRLVFTLTRPVYFDAVEARLYGHEFVKVRQHHSGKRHHSSTYTESAPFLDEPLALTHESGEPLDFGALDEGVHAYRFAALLSPAMPPSLAKSGGNLQIRVEYLVRASLSVPWRFDPSAVGPITVWAPPSPPVLGPVASARGPAFGTNLTSISGVLRESEVPRGGTVSGEFTVTTEGTRQLRSVTVKLVERWGGHAKGHGRGDHLVLAERKFTDAAFGRPVPVSIPVTLDAVPDYDGELCNVVHAIEAEADLSFAVNPAIAMPFIVS